MAYESFRLASLVGLPLKDSKERELGRITGFSTEGDELWATLDDDHEVRVHHLEEVMCLTDGAHYCRASVL